MRAETRARQGSHGQEGMFLLEGLIAILIFSLGILGMVAMAGTAISAQSDAQNRTDAVNFANDIASKIALNVDTTNVTTMQNSLLAFAHQPVGNTCGSFAGAPSTSPIVQSWVSDVSGATPGVTGLPGATNVSESIAVDTSQATYAKLVVMVCWKPPSTSATPLSPWHSHVLVSYVPYQS